MTYIPSISNSRLDNDAVTSSKILDATVVDADVAAENKDGVAGTPSLRTLGTGAQQAMAGSTRLDTIAAPTGSVSLNSQKITNLADGTASGDAVNYGQLQAATAGLDVKASVRAISTSNITLSGAQTIDGVSVVAGNRVLVAGQTTGANNGIYVAASGAWTRSTDADVSAEVTAGMFTFVEEGTLYQDTGWVLVTNDAITLGTTELVFTQFSAAATPATTLDSLSDVDTTGVVDGALLRYEATGTVWNETTAATLLLSDAGQLLIPTTGSGAGILLGGDAQLYRSAANMLRTPGNMTVDGTAALTGKVTFGASLNYKTRTVTSGSTTASPATDHTVLINFAGDVAVTVTAGALGDTVLVKDISGAAATNNITLTPSSGTIDGSATYVIAHNRESIELRSDGTNYHIV